eukprot:1140778-Pelagomonas_calceolata.AAC.2
MAGRGSSNFPSRPKFGQSSSPIATIIAPQPVEPTYRTTLMKEGGQSEVRLQQGVPKMAGNSLWLLMTFFCTHTNIKDVIPDVHGQFKN